MRILERSVYVGPSQHAHFPVIRLLLDLGDLEQWPTARLGPGFIDGLVIERDAGNRTQLNLLMTPNVVNGMLQLAARIEFIL